MTCPGRVTSFITALTAGVVGMLVLIMGLAGPTAAEETDEPRWVWPLDPPPEVVRGFHPPDTPWGTGHRGVDLAGELRQSVHAAGAGTVTYAGTLAGRGVVTVTHGAVRTTYEPVRSQVEVGHDVAAGDVIGVLQSQGQHCAPDHCLHWGLLRDSEYLDPLSLLADGPVRLLPLDDADAPSVAASRRAGPTILDAGAGQDNPPRPAAEETRPAKTLTQGLVGGMILVLIAGLLLARR